MTAPPPPPPPLAPPLAAPLAAPLGVEFAEAAAQSLFEQRRRGGALLGFVEPPPRRLFLQERVREGRLLCGALADHLRWCLRWGDCGGVITVG